MSNFKVLAFVVFELDGQTDIAVSTQLNVLTQNIYTVWDLLRLLLVSCQYLQNSFDFQGLEGLI